MKPDLYTCAACGGTFEKGWTDEEAEAEAIRLFGELPPEDKRSVICHDCHEIWLKLVKDGKISLGRPPSSLH